MYVSRIYYPVTTLGPGKRAGIWLAGCEKNCPNCISPELKHREAGRNISAGAVLKMLEAVQGHIEGVTISGGEPFLQAAELARLTEEISRRFTEDIILYTGYTLEELHARNDSPTERTLDNVAVLVDGPYLEELDDSKGIRGSRNQRVHIFKNAGEYGGLETMERKVQTVYIKGKKILIGLR